ncbi:hypothetical protein [Brevundimonas sp.]|uniref:hypothetical protein n=1 Tax=Brevundimonas sp. TaxID=1871086 RepID=UPI0028996019|nr:hypothetical protein [Brevundimonas sp.]
MPKLLAVIHPNGRRAAGTALTNHVLNGLSDPKAGTVPNSPVPSGRRDGTGLIDPTAQAAGTDLIGHAPNSPVPTGPTDQAPRAPTGRIRSGTDRTALVGQAAA